jgi:hypothetical protein
MSAGPVGLVDSCARKTGPTLKQTQIKLKTVSRSTRTVVNTVPMIISFQQKKL